MSDSNPSRPVGVPPGPVTFTDSLGVTWEVREIIPGPPPPKLLQLLGERRKGGWLLFLSADGSKRRLSPIPRGWRDRSRFELERLSMSAESIPPAPERRSADQGEGR
jgi:hypothetical protein